MKASTLRTVTGALVALVLTLVLSAAASARTRPFTMIPANPDAYIVNDAAMVPLRAIADIIGGVMQTDGPRLAIQYGDAEFACREGRTDALANGVEITLPCAPQDRFGVAYVPLRALVKALCGTLTVDGNTAVARIPGAPIITMRLVAGGFPKLESDTALFLVDLSTGDTQRLTYYQTDKFLPTFAPDKVRCIYGRDGTIYARAVYFPDETSIIPADTASYDSPAFLPDSRHIIYAGHEHKSDAFGNPFTSHIYQARIDGNDRRLLVNGEHPEVSPDGQWLTYDAPLGKDVYEVHLYQMATGQDLDVAPGSTPHFSPALDRLVYSRAFVRKTGAQVTLQVSCPINGLQVGKEVVPDVKVYDSDERCGGFTPDGKSLLVTGGGIRTVALDRSAARDLLIAPDTTEASFLPDGSAIAYLRHPDVADDVPQSASDTLDLWLIQPDGSAPHPDTQGLDVIGYTFAPDGKHALVFAYNRTEEPSAETTLPGSSGGALVSAAPAYTAADAAGYVAEVLPLVEKEAGVKFTVSPALVLASRADLARVITEELVMRVRVVYPDASRAELLGYTYLDGTQMAVKCLARYGKDDKALYLAAGSLPSLLPADKVDPALDAPILKLVIANELTHALQDQVLGLDGTFAKCASREQMLALTAALEGQALYIQDCVAQDLQLGPAVQEWARAFTTGSLTSISTPDDVMNSILPFADLSELYKDGDNFMIAIAAQGGVAHQWKVLAAPPVNTHMICHPELYTPVAPDTSRYLAALAGSEKDWVPGGWQVSLSETGELQLRGALRTMDPAERNTLLAGIPFSAASIATQPEGDAIATVALIVTSDPATAVKYIQAEEKVEAGNAGLQANGNGNAGQPVVGPFHAAQGDLARSRTLTIATSPDTTVTIKTVRVARGNLVVEVTLNNLARSDADIATVIEEVFRLLATPAK